MDKPLNRRRFLHALTAGLAMFGIARKVEAKPLTDRIKRSLERRADLGQPNGLIILSHEGFERVRAENGVRGPGGLVIMGVFCLRVHELHGDDYWICSQDIFGNIRQIAHPLHSELCG